MYCKKCGVIIDKKMKFCPYCGTEQLHSRKWLWLTCAVLVIGGICLWSTIQHNVTKNLGMDSIQMAASSKVSANNVGECYSIGNIKALTFEQMLFIASNKLSVEDIDKFGDLCGFKNVGKRDSYTDENCSHAFVSGGYSLEGSFGLVVREKGKDAFMFFVECNDYMYKIGVHSTSKEYFKRLHADIKKVCPTVNEIIINDYEYGSLGGTIEGLKYFDFNFDCQKDDIKYGYMELRF